MKFFSKKLLKICAITFIVLIALYAGVGFYFLPGIVKSKVIDQVSSTMGRKLTIGDLQINPFELSARVNNIVLFDKDGAGFTGMRELYINFQLRSLFNGTFTFAEISIDSPYVYVKMFPDSSTNYDNLIPESQVSTEPSEPKILVIEKLSIRQGSIIYEDQTRPTPLISRLDSLTFSLNNFTTQPQENGLYSFDAQTANNERLSWKGTIIVSPPQSTGSFTLSGLKGRTLWEFMQDRFDFEITQGELGVQGEYKFFMKDDVSEVLIQNTSASVNSLVIIDKNTKEEAFSLTSAKVSGIEFAYQQHKIRIGTISADSTTLFTTRETDGNYGLKKLLMPHPSPEKDTTKWDVLIDKIELRNWHCTVSDFNTSPPARLVLAPVSLLLENYHMDTGDTMRMTVQSGLKEGGTASLEGTVTLIPITANLNIECSEIALQPFQPYVDQFSRLIIQSGNLGVKGNLTYTEKGSDAEKTFNGDVTVSSFRGIDPVLQEDFIRWNQLSINTIEYTSAPSRCSIDQIIADESYLRVIIDSSRTTNIHHIMLQTSDSSSAPVKVEQEQKMMMQIRAITVRNSSMNFSDLSLLPNFSTGIQELNGSIKELSSEKLSHAAVALEGRVDKYAPVTIKGEINPLSDEVYTDILMKFQNIELTTFTPYSAKFAGYKIDKGKLSLELQYKLNQNHLNGENKVIVDQLTLGEAVEGPDVTGLPVKLAIALLKDTRGVIDLDLPIEGSLDDPDFAVFPVVMKVLVNLVTKAVTAPFKLLGSLFGGSDEDLSYVQFPAGLSELSSDQASKLGNLAKALAERPELQLDIRGVASDSSDRLALAMVSLTNKIRDSLAARTQRESFTPAEQDRLLQLYRTTFSRSPDSLITASERTGALSSAEQKRKIILDRAKEKLLSQTVITDQDLRSLAVNRAKIIKESLINQHKVDESRIFILDAQGGAGLVEGMVQVPLNLNAR
ncbi:MAG: DUF748 domain-containing protein [Bacteroidetes bacterium]|nr:MAG: DUF748 domain-containing protein [Bacteroidota bacterium]